MKNIVCNYVVRNYLIYKDSVDNNVVENIHLTKENVRVETVTHDNHYAVVDTICFILLLNLFKVLSTFLFVVDLYDSHIYKDVGVEKHFTIKVQNNVIIKDNNILMMNLVFETHLKFVLENIVLKITDINTDYGRLEPYYDSLYNLVLLYHLSQVYECSDGIVRYDIL